MKKEVIDKIEILKTGELLLALESGGDPSYQYIYREAAGVHWDNELNGFKTTIPRTMSYPEWFEHIVSIVKYGADIELLLGEHVAWKNVSDEIKQKILNVR